MQKFALIRWLEDPPKWDVISTDNFLPLVDWTVDVGDTVPVKYGTGNSPASVLNFGNYEVPYICL